MKKKSSFSESSPYKRVVNPQSYSPIRKDTKVFYNGLFGQCLIVNDLIHDKKVLCQNISIEGDSKKDKRFMEALDQISQLHHPSLNHVYGFTENNPHMLISEYHKHARMLNYIFKDKENNQWLNSTAKTVIALCVAKAMSYLHENDIVHGNLQPGTILIAREDNEGMSFYLPYLVDYGIARFSDVPPRRYVAPELQINSNEEIEYTKESDVFAFGVLLMELSRLKNCPSNLKTLKASDKATSSVNSMIQQCNKNDPKRRPTFTQIYEAIATHSLDFGADVKWKKVDFVIQRIKQFEIKNAIKKFKTTLDIRNKKFLYNVNLFAEELTFETAPVFFTLVGNYFTDKTPLQTFDSLLDCTQKLVQNRVFCKCFVEENVHYNLPFNKKQLANKAFNITYWIVQYQPNAISDIAKTLAYYMQFEPYTHKVLVLLDNFARKFHEIEDPWAFVDNVLLGLKKFEELKYLDRFISIYYFLCKYHPIYKKERLEDCAGIIAEFISSESNSAIRAVYAYFTEFKDVKITYKNFANFTSNHLVNPQTAEAAVTFLLVRRDFEINKEIVDSLITLSSKSSKANLLLCRIAETDQGSQLLMRQPKFIEAPLPDYPSTFRILLTLLRKDENLRYYKHSESFAFLLTNLCHSADDTILYCMENLIISLNVNSDFINDLDENNFCDEFYKAVENSSEADLFRTAIVIFRDFAQKNPNLEFYRFLTESLQEILKYNKSIQAEVLEFFTVMSTNNGCIDLLINYPVEEVFRNLTLRNDTYQQHVDIIKQNILAYQYKNNLILPSSHA